MFDVSVGFSCLLRIGEIVVSSVRKPYVVLLVDQVPVTPLQVKVQEGKVAKYFYSVTSRHCS